MKQSQLIQELMDLSTNIQAQAKVMDQLPLAKLTQRSELTAWNALECFEHLNLYIDIYNKFFEEALTNAPTKTKDFEIRRGYWGNRFINWMKPTKNGIKKMDTFKSKNPLNQSLEKSVIQHFVSSNELTISYLEKAKMKDIQQAKCKLAIPILKLKLSDAFCFLIAHNERHLIQAQAAAL